MTHGAESKKTSRTEREKANAVQTIIHTITDRHRFPNLSDHFVDPPEPLAPLQGPHMYGFTLHGEYDELHRAYFEKPKDA